MHPFVYKRYTHCCSSADASALPRSSPCVSILAHSCRKSTANRVQSAFEALASVSRCSSSSTSPNLHGPILLLLPCQLLVDPLLALQLCPSNYKPSCSFPLLRTPELAGLTFCIAANLQTNVLAEPFVFAQPLRLCWTSGPRAPSGERLRSRAGAISRRGDTGPGRKFEFEFSCCFPRARAF